MKHFYTVLAAALMASAVATAQPTPSKGMRFNYDKKQVAAKKVWFSSYATVWQPNCYRQERSYSISS